MNKTTNEFEHRFWPNKVLGIDEAGRGPLAGPLVVAGVILPSYYENEEIYDSKKLSHKKRDYLYDLIMEEALSFKIVVVKEEVIDSVNIYQATKNAMYEIAESLDCQYVLSDAMDFKVNNKEVISLIKGDQKSISIAAASILAKVTRDRIMMEYDFMYPHYNFKKNMGYPTRDHLLALEKYGICKIHRKSYGPVKKALQLKLDL